MKNLKYIFINLFVLVSLLSCSSDDDNTTTQNLDATKIYEELNVSYGDDEDQVFDIYLPANRTLSTKYMILVHGGGWTSGDKTDMNNFIDLIQQNFSNLGIININYRLASAGNSPFPMQTDDITTIINKLKEKQVFYTIGDEFGFIGTSAGAHLSMLWSYNFDTENKSKMVCSIVGPTNFTDPSYDEPDYAIIQASFGVIFPNQTDTFLESVSPYHTVTADAQPTILFYGDSDPLIPTTQGVEMKAKLDALNVVNEFTLYEGEGHGWVGLNAIDTWTKLSAFMDTHLLN